MTLSSRIEFNEYLKGFAENVYFQPPSDIKIKYPAIIYDRKDIGNVTADNTVYLRRRAYSVQVIDKNPDSTIAEDLMNDASYCSFDSQFVLDGLNHISLTIYY